MTTPKHPNAELIDACELALKYVRQEQKATQRDEYGNLVVNYGKRYAQAVVECTLRHAIENARKLDPPKPPVDGSGASNCRPQQAWSTDPPTEPGWYWVRYSIDGCENVLGIAYVDAELDVSTMGRAMMWQLSAFINEYSVTEWLKMEEPEVEE